MFKALLQKIEDLRLDAGFKILEYMERAPEGRLLSQMNDIPLSRFLKKFLQIQN